MNYVPSTIQERRRMLDALGVPDVDALYRDIPEGLRFRGGYAHLPQEGRSELEVMRLVSNLAGENVQYKSIFRGAGAYHHYIPACVGHLASRSEFVTAYTPYQPEMSQGILQAIFEYQTTICALTGLEVSNASVYDGATAAAEAVSMCIEKGARAAVVSGAINPGTMAVLATYARAMDIELRVCPQKGGLTDMDALQGLMEGAACVYLETPNYYGLIEDGQRAADIAHAAKGRLIAGVNPMSLALLKPPGEYGADIAVGDGQPLGLPLSFGGPYLGFMACKKELMRKLPGRIVGQTKDLQGNRAFVLTLQAREQHIRREKALSNICSNQALCALTATIYCAAMGPQGLYEAAYQCAANAAYLKKRLSEIGFMPVYTGDTFHEFVTDCPGDSAKYMAALAEHGILGGLPIGQGRILWCATEMTGEEEIDRMISILGGEAGC